MAETTRGFARRWIPKPLRYWLVLKLLGASSMDTEGPAVVGFTTLVDDDGYAVIAYRHGGGLPALDAIANNEHHYLNRFHREDPAGPIMSRFRATAEGSRLTALQELVELAQAGSEGDQVGLA